MRWRMRAIFRYALFTLRNFLPIRTDLFPRIDARLSGLGFCPATSFTTHQDRDGFIIIVMPLGALICFEDQTESGAIGV
jgi:hypothetical protein